MPRQKQQKRTSRLNLEMSTEVRGRLEDLQKETNALSLTEVIQRSLALYEVMVRVSKTGGTIFVRERGQEKQLLLF